MTFANRPGLLSVDAILKRLHDTEPGIPELAELILKGRGLNKEQIFLGRQIFNPHPEVRASVIPLIRDRTDIDPVVWLLQLSHDADETVRAKAVEALVEPRLARGRPAPPGDRPDRLLGPRPGRRRQARPQVDRPRRPPPCPPCPARRA